MSNSTSADVEIEGFYEDLDRAMRQCKSKEVVLITGDSNAKVGKGREGNTADHMD